MKTYAIQKLHNSIYPFVVLSTSYQNPLDEIKAIEEELKDNYKGKIVFDLLLSNGLSSNRFLEAEFDGDQFIISTFKPVEIIDILIKQTLTDFYRSNIQYVESSVLPKSQKFLLKKGNVIL